MTRSDLIWPFCLSREKLKNTILMRGQSDQYMKFFVRDTVFKFHQIRSFFWYTFRATKYMQKCDWPLCVILNFFADLSNSWVQKFLCCWITLFERFLVVSVQASCSKSQIYKNLGFWATSWIGYLDNETSRKLTIQRNPIKNYTLSV